MMAVGSLGSGELEKERGWELGSRCGELEFLWGPAEVDAVSFRATAGAAVPGKTTFLCAA